MKRRVIFVITKEVHALDLAGPLQVFYEAGTYGLSYQILYVSQQRTQQLSAHLGLNKLHPFKDIQLKPQDIILIPGFNTNCFVSERDGALFSWLRMAAERGVLICSVCTGAFLLAAAGLLDGRYCTTHWKYIQALQAQYPKTKVQKDKIFVCDENIYSSAGVTTGIDLALYIIEQRHGSEIAYKIAREIVVYTRRSGEEKQQSIFLLYHQHMNSSVHALQDWILQNLNKPITLETLALRMHTSSRNLTRLFKKTTGITIGQYVEKLRLEIAVQLLKKQHKVESVATRCGLKTTTQLRSLLKKHAHLLPSAIKKMS